jgi:hypothetical protein
VEQVEHLGNPVERDATAERNPLLQLEVESLPGGWVKLLRGTMVPSGRSRCRTIVSMPPTPAMPGKSPPEIVDTRSPTPR